MHIRIYVLRCVNFWKWSLPISMCLILWTNLIMFMWRLLCVWWTTIWVQMWFRVYWCNFCPAYCHQVLLCILFYRSLTAYLFLRNLLQPLNILLIRQTNLKHARTLCFIRFLVLAYLDLSQFLFAASAILTYAILLGYVVLDVISTLFIPAARIWITFSVATSMIILISNLIY